MLYYKGTKEINLSHTVVALGKFDGLHRGHQLLLQKLNDYKKKGYQTVVFTFDFHPMSVLMHKKQMLIDTQEERRSIVEKMGIDVLIEYPFNEDTAHTPPEEFIRDVLVKCLDAKMIVVGEDFRFGYQRRGDVQMLLKYASELGYQVDYCEKLTDDGRVISSTLIREALNNADIETVNRLLGRTYSVTGTVISGRANGRKVKMPTANIIPSDSKLLPPEGVYITTTYIPSLERTYRSLTNIGCNPTISDQEALRIETFIFDFSGNLYDETIVVHFYKRVRGEKKFADLSALRVQVSKDQDTAMLYFKQNEM